ncbi:MAG: hypothetical protein Q9217_006872 [Psora testacea]
MPGPTRYDSSSQAPSRVARSPRTSSRTSPPRQTLPPISDLLNCGIPARHEATGAGSGYDRERLRTYSPSSSHPARTLADGRHSHRQPLSPEDQRRDQIHYDARSRPMRSGPPQQQFYATPSATVWSKPSSSAASDHSHSVPPPPQRSVVESPYTTPGRQSPYDRYDREGGSSLPPPPPSYQNSESYRPNDPTTSIYSHRHGSYDSSSRNEGLLRSSEHYSVPPPPGSGYPAPRPYGEQSRIETPAPYANHASHDHHSQATDGYSSHQIPSYESTDERQTRRRRGNLPKWATDYLKQWFFDHVAHPYPTEQEKQDLCKITGLGMTQLSNWFINARRRQTPALNAQAQAENMIRESSGQSRSRSDSDDTGNGQGRRSKR